MNWFKELFNKDSRDYCVKVSDLRVKYDERLVLDNINLIVKKKDVFGIIGLSGSGKSTLLKSLMGFTRHKGRVTYGSGRIGYCPQEDAFFKDLSIEENIKLFGRLVSVDPINSLKLASKLLKQLQINESLNKPVKELSGGQRKRLNIILSILHDPDTIILDEPFAGLDYLTRRLLWRFINYLQSKKKTIILTTHLLNEAQKHCSNLLIISEGKKYASGSISKLKRSLKFQQFLQLKFKHLNNEHIKHVENYCKKRGIKVLELDHQIGGFGLPEADDRTNFLSMIKRLNEKYRVEEYRPPTLNELFVVSVK